MITKLNQSACRNLLQNSKIPTHHEVMANQSLAALRNHSQIPIHKKATTCQLKTRKTSIPSQIFIKKRLRIGTKHPRILLQKTLCSNFETSKPSPKSGGPKSNFHNFANFWTPDPSTLALYQLPAPMTKTPGEDRPLSSLKVIPIITEKPVSV